MGFSDHPLLSFLRDQQQTPVSKDTVTPANSRPLPVELTGLNGDVSIDAASLNLDVQLTAFGGNPDSVLIGLGADLVSSSNPFPVTVTSSDLPSGAATAEKQDTGNTTANNILTRLADRTQKTILTDGTNDHVFSDVNGIKTLQIDVVRTVSVPGTGVSQSDTTAFTTGSTAFTPTGGLFNDAAADLTSGTAGVPRVTQKRAFHVNLRDASGNEVLANPLDKYRIADEDSLGLVKYYGFAAASGASKWIILRQDTTTSPYTYRYASISNNATRTDYGAAGASGAWANRVSLTYGYLYTLTGL